MQKSGTAGGATLASAHQGHLAAHQGHFPAGQGNLWDTEYERYLARVQARILANAHGTPLFTTSVDSLFHFYMDALPDEERPAHLCRCCEGFIQKYGGLVTIDEHGRMRSAIWDIEDAEGFYRPVTSAMLAAISQSSITGVFLSSEGTWGHPLTGLWRHYGFRPTAAMIYRERTKTASQVMAEKREDFKTLSIALAELSQDTVEMTLRLLQSGALSRSEHVLGPAQFLCDLYLARRHKGRPMGSNLIWRAVATAPAGFCHPRSSMLGTLLDDIAAGKAFDTIKASFDAKMIPTQYQRPKAAPSAQTITQAEEIVRKLGAEGSLARRFLRPAEVRAIWTPQQPDPPTGQGIFSHLATKDAPGRPAFVIPPVAMSWTKFEESVLPKAERIEYMTQMRDNHCTLITGVNPDAPPILQWDLEEERNPCSWYVWTGGSSPGQFGLAAGVYVPVSAITRKPCEWGSKPFPHHGEGVILTLGGARETRFIGGHIFPETLRAEFREVRSVIEAFSAGQRVQDIEGSHVVGPLLSKGRPWTARVRVTAGGITSHYDLDRWE